MEQSRLDKEMIAQPELWRLVLMLSPDRLDVALFPPVAREEMIWRSFMFDSAAPSPLKALEDVIYDNPLLLSDFRRVDCLIDNSPRLMVPVGATPDDCMSLMAESYPESEVAGGVVEMYETGMANAMHVLVQSPDVKAFLLRTFYNIRFMSRQAALCSYFAMHADGMPPCRVYALSRYGKIVVVAIDGTRLLMANEFRYRVGEDAAYYVLASMQHLGLGAGTCVAVGGDDDDVAGMLRRYLSDVRSVPFPALRYRASKSTLKAPFDLIIQSLCE